MKIDIREIEAIRETVKAAIVALNIQARQIWGPAKHPLDEIVIRLMVGVGDIARLERDYTGAGEDQAAWRRQLAKEFGNVLFSTIRWIDDLGLDPLECLDLAIEAQEKFAKVWAPEMSALKPLPLFAALITTGCADTIDATAHLANATRGISWPGAFLCVGVVASLCYVIARMFG